MAGLSLGIAMLRRGFSVELHEAGRYPRHRVCGEFLCGVSDGVLGELGVEQTLREAVILRSSRWHHRHGAVLESTLEARGLSRHRLDDLLQALFQNLGGTLVTGSRIPPARGIVWAAGRRRSRSGWIGLKCHHHSLPMGVDLEMHVGKGGYVGLARIEGGRVNLCGLFRRREGLAAKGSSLLLSYLRSSGLLDLAERVEASDPVEESFCAVAGIGFHAGPDHDFAIGDASRVIPPFTGNGMSMAFESAFLAVDPLERYLLGKCSWEEARRAHCQRAGKFFGRRLLAARILHPFLRQDHSLRWIHRLGIARALPVSSLHRLLR